MLRLVETLCGRTGAFRAAALVLATAIGMLFFVPLVQAQSHKDWPSRLTFATGPSGGFGTTMSAPLAATMGSATGVAISPEVTNGFPFNIEETATKQADMGIGTTAMIVLGKEGKGFFKGKPSIKDVRTLFMFVPSVFQMYTDARSNIKSLKDVNGKIVNPSRAGSGTDVVFRAIVKTLGLKPKEITNVSPPQANSLMADGRVDVAIGMGAVPHPAAMQYQARTRIRVIGFTKAERARFLAANPQLSPMTVPAHSFKGQNKPLLTVGSYTMVVVNKDLPSSLVYAMLKAMYGHKADLASAYKPYSKLSYKSILHSPIPLHPGAVKFFEDHGIKLPARLKG